MPPLQCFVVTAIPRMLTYLGMTHRVIDVCKYIVDNIHCTLTILLYVCLYFYLEDILIIFQTLSNYSYCIFVFSFSLFFLIGEYLSRLKRFDYQYVVTM